MQIKSNDIRRIVKNIPAMVTYREGELLFNLARQVSTGVIVEIGSYKGGSTILLAKGSDVGNHVPVFAIDPHKRENYTKWEKELVPKNTYHLFNKNLKRYKVSHRVTLIMLKSQLAVKKWKKDIGLLWIDGDHTYEQAKLDFLCWEKFLVPGGVIAFHDSADAKTITTATGCINKQHGSATRVIQEFVVKSGRYSTLQIVDSITYAVKIRNAKNSEAMHTIAIIWTTRMKPLFRAIDKQIGKGGIVIRKVVPFFSSRKYSYPKSRELWKKYMQWSACAKKMNVIKTKGLISTTEGKLLYAIAATTKGDILEIGPRTGLSTLYIASAIKDNNSSKQQVYTIELNPTKENFKIVQGGMGMFFPKNSKSPLTISSFEHYDKEIKPALSQKGRFITSLKKSLKRFSLSKYVQIIEGDFRKVTPKKKFPFIFADVLHSELEIKRNAPKIKGLLANNAIIACHDLTNDTLRKCFFSIVPLQDFFMVDQMLIGIYKR